MLSILLVEDEDGALGSLRALLERQGYEVRVAGSGAEALELVRRDPPDLAVLGGEAGGLAICRALREDGWERPVILVFSEGMTEQDKMLAFEVGADDCVTRPFSLPVLKARIEANLRRSGWPFTVFRRGGSEVER